MTPQLQRLVDHSRGQAGQLREVDFGVTSGPLAELAALLSAHNGFFVFNAGVQIYRAGEPGMGPELQQWNQPDTWKDTYQGLADGLFCFGQDLFGYQFAIDDRHKVVTFDPETAERIDLGDSLEDWADWLWYDPDVHGGHAFATTWKDQHGPLEPDQRLVPGRLFILGGTYDDTNLAVEEATTCMRIRGRLAQTISRSADGACPSFPQLAFRDPEPQGSEKDSRRLPSEVLAAKLQRAVRWCHDGPRNTVSAGSGHERANSWG